MKKSRTVANCQIPQFDGVVNTATGKDFTIGTYSNGTNTVPISLSDFSICENASCERAIVPVRGYGVLSLEVSGLEKPALLNGGMKIILSNIGLTQLAFKNQAFLDY